MSSDASPRSRRDRPAKPALSRDAIVDAALAIVREEGIDALSMRRVAQALDTGPASLYVYVANRDALWELLFDAALATVATEPTDPERWREQLHELAARIVQMMAVDYPGMARLAMAHIPVGDNSLRVVESMLSLLKAGGVERPGCGLRGRPDRELHHRDRLRAESLRSALQRPRARGARGRAHRRALRRPLARALPDDRRARATR